jgi:ribonuclease HII
MNLFASATIPPPDRVAGVDEAGRGCLAGPVVAAAVILPASYDLPGLGDSKKLTRAGRERLEPLIKNQAVAWSLGLSWPREIETVNILQASLLAMRRAVSTLRVLPAYVLVDGNQKIPFALPQESVIGGDAKVPCISAASVLAKVFRDRLLIHLDRRYPGYDLAVHKGYGTKVHREILQQRGPCPIHRTTFRGVGDVPLSKEKTLCLPGLES